MKMLVIGIEKKRLTMGVERNRLEGLTARFNFVFTQTEESFRPFLTV